MLTTLIITSNMRIFKSHFLQLAKISILFILLKMLSSGSAIMLRGFVGKMLQQEINNDVPKHVSI